MITMCETAAVGIEAVVVTVELSTFLMFSRTTVLQIKVLVYVLCVLMLKKACVTWEVVIPLAGRTPVV